MTFPQQALSKDAIVRALHDLGLSPGAVVLVHSSLSSIGWVEGGAGTVIDALCVAVAPGGTVLVPTLTGTAQDGPDHPPVFDPSATPCWTGAIPETARVRPDARRSCHPTHSVGVIGPAADALIDGHEYCPTPCSAESPYGRLAEAGGFILLLGITHDSNTCLHMVEELAGAPYHLQDRPTLARVARDDGTWEEIATTLHLWRWERDFPRVDPLLRDIGAQREGLVGRAHCRLIDVRAMRDALVPLVRREPLLLLSDAARVAYSAAMP